MIIVKVELHSARTGQITELGRAHISNTGDNPSHPTRGSGIATVPCTPEVLALCANRP